MTDPTEALAERLFRDAAGALELYTIYLGERLGLYRALHEGGPATSGELAARTGTNERYVREWLEHHAASGLLDVDDVAADPLARRFSLPAAHAPVLLDRDDVRFGAYRAIDIVRAARPLPDLVDAFRNGTAPPPLPWEPEGRAADNRAVYLAYLGNEWLPAIPDIDRRLRADPPARVADLACGLGWSSIAIARAYPLVKVEGFDLDAAAIASAVDTAAAEGLADRLSFTVADAADPGLSGRFDLVTILEGFHDMARPVQALRAVRAMLADGAVGVDDRRAGRRRIRGAGRRPGALPLRLERRGLPARRNGRPADRGHRRSHAGQHTAAVRGGRRLPVGRGAADRDTRVAVLPPAPLSSSATRPPPRTG